MYQSREQRSRVEGWIEAQATTPSRKQTQQQFPAVPQKHIRAALQSRMDRERKAALTPPVCARCGREVPTGSSGSCPGSNFTEPCAA